jgi:hypothetical protein
MRRQLGSVGRRCRADVAQQGCEHLSGAHCFLPAGFPTAAAYTQYIEATIDVPFIGLQQGAQSIDTIVHEHYDGRSVAQARNLERMYFGKNLGRYRWQYWVPDGSPRRPLVCPLAYSAPPARAWVMVDCRMWMVPNTTNFSLATYGWGYP